LDKSRWPAMPEGYEKKLQKAKKFLESV
jgi:hypothetical protein